MTDLYERVVFEISRRSLATLGAQGAAHEVFDALRVAVVRHRLARVPVGWMPVCLTCVNGDGEAVDFPCAELVAIAETLGVTEEVDDGSGGPPPVH